MKKVLVLFPRFGIGGIAKASTFVANSLCEKGYDVLCVSMSDDEIMQSFDDRAKKIVLPYEKAGVITRGRKIEFLLLLRSLIIKEKIECVIALGTDLARIVTIATTFKKTKIVASERGNPFLYSNKARKKYIKALNKCNKIVFQTEEARSYYPQEIQRKSVIIPNPCYIKGNIKIQKSDLSGKILLVVSRISEEKNVLGIVKAFKAASSKLSEYKLCIYGDGDKKAEIEQYVKDQSIQNIHFYCNTANPFEKCRNASLYIINSNTEGMPNSLIEAMLYGIPCIATDCPPGGVRFLADGGRRACLVPVNDEEALSNAMVKVLTDMDYRDSLVKAAEEIKEELNPKIIAEKWVSLVDGCFEANS